ncbi:MAG: HU family DNA-binding protein [Planctomycetota bacterium]|nr:MAG: HU family DNA-binding protein [Planctomycetota bacterium]
MTTVTKKDLIEQVARDTGLKRVVVKRLVQSLLDNMIYELGRGNRLELRDFGVFETKLRAPRTAQNPRTLQRVKVPAKTIVKFKVGRLMQRAVEDLASAGESLDVSEDRVVTVDNPAYADRHTG